MTHFVKWKYKNLSPQSSQLMAYQDQTRIRRIKGNETSHNEASHDFEQFNLNLDGDLMTIWTEMADAKVLIMSKSDFSFVPAFLNNNTVLQIPWLNPPLKGWKVVDESILKNAEKERKKMCEAEKKKGIIVEQNMTSGGYNMIKGRCWVVSRMGC